MLAYYIVKDFKRSLMGMYIPVIAQLIFLTYKYAVLRQPNFIYSQGIFVKGKKIPFKRMSSYQFIKLKHNHQVEIDYTAGKILSQSKSIIIRMSSSQKMRLESYLKRHNIFELS